MIVERIAAWVAAFLDALLREKWTGGGRDFAAHIKTRVEENWSVPADVRARMEAAREAE
jgi:hypothetical protein